MSDFKDLQSVEKYLKKKGFSVTRATIINWCKSYKVGKKIGGKWYMKEDDVDKLLSGDIKKPLNVGRFKKDQK